MSDDHDFLMEAVREYRVLDLDRRLKLADDILVNIQTPLYIYVLGLVGQSLLGDVIQETTIAIFKSLGTFKGESRGQFFAWWRRIARNKASDEFKKRGPIRDEPFTVEDNLLYIERLIFQDSRSMGSKLDLEYALNLLAKSAPECRDLLWNYYVIDMDYDEIAEAINLKYDAVRMRIARCLEIARRLLEP